VFEALLLLLVCDLLAVGEHSDERNGKVPIALMIAIPIACPGQKDTGNCREGKGSAEMGRHIALTVEAMMLGIRVVKDDR